MKRKFRSAVPYQTQTAGTAIVALIPGRRNHLTSVDRIQMTSGSTLHVNNIMKPATRTTLSANAASGQAVINVTAALLDGGGNAIASGDYVCVELADGTYHMTTFTSAATLAYTLAVNLPSAAKKGGNVFCYGVAGDSFQDQSFSPTISSTDLSLPAAANAEDALYVCRMMDAPMIYYNPNASNADFVKQIQFSHCKL